ncbi:hypothetical protein CMUS01_08997 [Colletotrichum musicola]|uniref:Uncharacterized protein n=1 Tax=Colletotrichum musicola TaxID=2175873 RepID=A0A8H6K9G7_9PEZI|nr:hypothetical protein CMUS01_08997 [Colletotrichum musicola]
MAKRQPILSVLTVTSLSSLSLSLSYLAFRAFCVLPAEKSPGLVPVFEMSCESEAAGFGGGGGGGGHDGISNEGG